MTANEALGITPPASDFIPVCFLAYVLWKTLAQMCQAGGLGHEPPRVIDDVGEFRVMDVVSTTSEQIDIRRRCVSRPIEHQAVLLERRGLELPQYLEIIEM